MIIIFTENITVNCEYTKKNCTKLSFIANTDKIILSITHHDIANKEIDCKEINKQTNKQTNKRKN